MRQFLLACFVFAGFALSAQYGPSEPIASAAFSEEYRTAFTEAEEQDVKRRLSEMQSIIGMHDHEVIESYIRGYMLRNRAKSEMILGRIPTYFPLFEEELRKAGLPDDLKYLAIVESALEPRALSRSGAGGLWQFMPGTGAMFGLTINNSIDERGDVEKATKAAVEYLRQEYERFGDWALVLAAYNGGPGRVSRAKRRSGKDDYWEMRRFLPRETRNYVPAFVAAMYLHKYGVYHGLQPQKITLDEQFPVAIATPYGISLMEIAQATGLTLEMVKAMNPHCLTDYVPAGPGAKCRVPARFSESVKTYLNWRQNGAESELISSIRSRPVTLDGYQNNDHHYKRVALLFPEKTSLANFSRQVGYSEHHLRNWNPYIENYAAYPQELIAYEPRFKPRSPFDLPEKLDIIRFEPKPLKALPLSSPSLPAELMHRAPNATYTLKRYESLLEVYQQFADTMTWQEMRKWNAINDALAPKAGTKVNVRM